MTNKEMAYRVARYERRYALMEELIEIEKTLEVLNSAGITPSSRLIDYRENLRIIRDGDAPRAEFLAEAPRYIKDMFRDAKTITRGA